MFLLTKGFDVTEDTDIKAVDFVKLSKLALFKIGFHSFTTYM